jgi:hypothetical protein
MHSELATLTKSNLFAEKNNSSILTAALLDKIHLIALKHEQAWANASNELADTGLRLKSMNKISAKDYDEILVLSKDSAIILAALKRIVNSKNLVLIRMAVETIEKIGLTYMENVARYLTPFL